jgi:gluconate 2-dehydrogenase gamma chain
MSEPETRSSINPNEHERSIISRRSFLKGSSAAAAAATIAVGRDVSAQDGTPSPVASPVASPAASPAAMDHAAMEEERAVEFFTPHESVTVEALAARLIPGSTDDPGAREAGVVFYIDRSLSGTNLGYSLKTYIQGPFPFTEEEQTPVEISSAPDNYRAVPVTQDTISRYGYQSVLTPQEIYRRGLGFLDNYTQEQFEANFVDLSEADQDAVVTSLAADEATGFDGPSGRGFFTQLRNDTIAGMFADPMYGGNRDMAGWRLIGYPGAQRFYTPDDLVNPDFQREPQSLAQLMAAEGH